MTEAGPDHRLSLGAISPVAVGLILIICCAPIRIQRAAVVSELSAKAGVSTTYASFNYVLKRKCCSPFISSCNEQTIDVRNVSDLPIVNSQVIHRRLLGTAAFFLQPFRATLCTSPLPHPLFLFLTQVWFSLSARDLSESSAPTKSVQGRSSLFQR